MERLTLDHINGLIEKEHYVVEEQYVQCILTVGEAPVIGISYRFSKATHDPERAKKAARDDAIRQLFSLEAYHQKRIRPKVNKDGNIPLMHGDNPFEGMAKRDVALMVGDVNCQEALKECGLHLEKEKARIDAYREGKDDDITNEVVLMQATTIADLCNSTVLREPTPLTPNEGRIGNDPYLSKEQLTDEIKNAGSLFDQRNKTM